MKILFLTDTHIRGSTPANRRDNLLETLKEKLKEVVSLANDIGVDLVLHGGDFFDITVPSPQAVSECFQILMGLSAPLLGVYGNHDISSANETTLKRTMLGVVSMFGAVQLLKRDEPLKVEARGIRATITGCPYHFDIDCRDPVHDYIVPKDPESDITIHLVHGMLIEHANFPGDHTLIKDITSTGADITLAGHNHLGFGAIQEEGRWFVNPGALVRLNNHRREMERRVQVALLDFTGGSIKIEMIPLQCARPGEEVLDRTEIEKRESRSFMLEQFTREVRSAANLQTWDLMGLVNQIASLKSIDRRVREEALRRIEEAKEALQAREGIE